MDYQPDHSRRQQPRRSNDAQRPQRHDSSQQSRQDDARRQQAQPRHQSQRSERDRQQQRSSSQSQQPRHSQSQQRRQAQSRDQEPRQRSQQSRQSNQQQRRRPQQHRRQNSRTGIIALLVAVVVLIAVIAIAHPWTYAANDGISEGGMLWGEPVQRTVELSGKLDGAQETIDSNGIVHGTLNGVNYVVRGRGMVSETPEVVTLAAVGDQMCTDSSAPIAQRYATEQDDGFNFTPFYREIAPVIQACDLRYINQETVMGTDAGLPIKYYPNFNSPNSMAKTINDVGFNMVGFATNHIWDWGASAIEASHAVWDQYPQITVAGSYLTQEERDTVQMLERNGITFAFLQYTYGDNTYPTDDVAPNTYYNCMFDKDVMATEIARAKQVADVVIVGIHWGTEYTYEPNSQQYDYASFLADQGVDLVLGEHAHCTQPVQFITGEQTGNRIPVVFGMSDILSGWTKTDCILSGIFTCSFTRTEVQDAEGNTSYQVSVGDCMWHPTIEWSDGGDVYIRQLATMDDETINANTRTQDVGNDAAYIEEMLTTCGMEVPMDWPVNNPVTFTVDGVTDVMATEDAAA